MGCQTYQSLSFLKIKKIYVLNNAIFKPTIIVTLFCYGSVKNKGKKLKRNWKKLHIVICNNFCFCAMPF